MCIRQLIIKPPYYEYGFLHNKKGGNSPFFIAIFYFIFPTFYGFLSPFSGFNDIQIQLSIIKVLC